jgi:hypothetical protein
MIWSSTVQGGYLVKVTGAARLYRAASGGLQG